MPTQDFSFIVPECDRSSDGIGFVIIKKNYGLFSNMNNTFLCFLCFNGFILVIVLYWIAFTSVEARDFTKVRPVHNVHLFGAHIYPSQCTESHRVIVIVTSYAGHVELRRAHRAALPQRYLDQFNATRIFLLAQIPQKEKGITQSAINDESSRFGDILQGVFVEHYRNLTYKHLMGLHWTGISCSHADYVIKVDDDIIFNWEIIYSLLGEYKSNDKLVVGYVLNGAKVFRERENKWYVSKVEYPNATYPAYLSGWLYITTPRTALALVEASSTRPYFWIDDVFITGILTRDLDVRIVDLKAKNIWLEYYELIECCLRDMIEKNIKCEYAVGPNGGRNDLILKFNEALHRCESSISCHRRSEKTLKETCIMKRERTVFGSGQASVQMIN